MTELQRRLGAWTRPDLHRKGLSRGDIDRMIDTGRLHRAGDTWLTTDSTPPDVVAALESGHRLTCISALRHHDVWTPIARGRHEMGRRCACAPHSDVVRHGYLRTWPDHQPIASLPLALHHCTSCLDGDDAAILFESVLARRLMGRSEVDALVASLPVRVQKRLGSLNGLAESGTETKVRRFFERRGIRVTPQVHIGGVGRVDLLVGDLLVIECDSRQFHTGQLEYATDRRRDLELVRRGFQVVRLTWEMVMLHWGATQLHLQGLIGERKHLARRRRSA